MATLFLTIFHNPLVPRMIAMVAFGHFLTRQLSVSTAHP